MDIRYNHPTPIHVVRSCLNDDATDLLAIGGEHSVDVILVTDSTCRSLASFHIGSRITALAWSSAAVSPTSSDQWFIELTAASTDFCLHLLTKSPTGHANVFPFGGGLSGHHGKVNDMSFCGGRSEDSGRYVATVSDDKMLMVWDLQPTVSISSGSPARSPPQGAPLSRDRPQPTAYVISFPYPLATINSNPSTSKEFLVSDCRGSIFLTDWRSDPQDIDPSIWRCSSPVELVEPYTLSDTMGLGTQCSGSVAWRRDTPDVIGAVYGPRFFVWNTSNLFGGKPFAGGISFPEGGHRFRWCHTYPEYFAISAQLPDKGAVVHIHNINYLQAQPTILSIDTRPHMIQDFDFLALRGIPRIAAAVGRTLVVFSIGVDS